MMSSRASCDGTGGGEEDSSHNLIAERSEHPGGKSDPSHCGGGGRSSSVNPDDIREDAVVLLLPLECDLPLCGDGDGGGKKNEATFWDSDGFLLRDIFR